MNRQTRQERVLYRMAEMICQQVWPDDWASHMLWFADRANQEIPARLPRNKVEMRIPEVTVAGRPMRDDL